MATLVLADISLESLMWWLILGLVAGFLASIGMQGGRCGIVGDLIVGLIGAFIGGWLFTLLGVSAGGGLIGSIIIAFIGAFILTLLLRVFTGGFTHRPL